MNRVLEVNTRSPYLVRDQCEWTVTVQRRCSFVLHNTVVVLKQGVGINTETALWLRSRVSASTQKQCFGCEAGCRHQHRNRALGVKQGVGINTETELWV